MRTGTRRHTKRGGHRTLFVHGGFVLFVWFTGWSFSGPVPKPEPGSSRCREIPGATTEQYLTGEACPPEGFAETLGYQPALEQTSFGWRYTRPEWADGRCNGPLAGLDGPLGFVPACRTHDYGYDLVRFGVGSRPAADDLLFRDMMALCADRDPVSAGGCRALAHWTKATLRVGDATGFDPELPTAA